MRQLGLLRAAPAILLAACGSDDAVGPLPGAAASAAESQSAVPGSAKVYCIGTSCFGVVFAFTDNVSDPLFGRPTTSFSVYLQNLQGTYPTNGPSTPQIITSMGFVFFDTQESLDWVDASPNETSSVVGNVAVGTSPGWGNEKPTAGLNRDIFFADPLGGIEGCNGRLGNPPLWFGYRSCPRDGLDGWVRLDFVLLHRGLQASTTPIRFDDFRFWFSWNQSGSSFVSGPTCSFGGGQPPTCAEFPYETSLTINAQAIGSTGTFEFAGTGTSVPANFSLNTFPVNPTTASAFSIPIAALGTKFVQQIVPNGWTLTNITCTNVNGATVVIGRGGSAAFVNGGSNDFDAGDNTVQVTLDAGNTPACTFVNMQQPTAGTRGPRGIGYWKNWSSCSGGEQYEKALAEDNLESTLDFYLGSVSMYPIGTISSLQCAQAVALLSKNAVDGSNRAGDPIYNLVAQLLGAKVNRAAGAGVCTAVNDAFMAAQTLLLAVGFDGNEYFSGKKQNAVLSGAQRTQAVALADIFGSYNEGTFGGGCPSNV